MVKIRLIVICAIVVGYLGVSSIASYLLYDSHTNYVYTVVTKEVTRQSCLQGSNWSTKSTHVFHEEIVAALGYVSGLVDGIRLTWKNGNSIPSGIGSDGQTFVLDALKHSPGKFDSAWSSDLVHSPIMYIIDSDIISVRPR